VVIVLCVVSTFLCPASAPRFYVSFALLAAGCWLHVLVKGQLIRNVTLCTQGAYATVRHPYYLANYLIDSSFCLLSGSVYLVLSYPFLFFWAYGSTLREEESRLALLHAGDFDAYRADVPRVFPDSTVLARLRTLGNGFSWRRVTWGEAKRVFRFGFVGTLLALLQHTGIDGWKQIRAGHNPLDAGGAVWLGCCAVLLLSSVAIPRRYREVPCLGDAHDDAD